MLSSFANFDFDETAVPVSSIVDYSRIFDETDLDDLFRSEGFNGADTERSLGGGGGGGASVVSNPDAEPATQSPTATPSQPATFAEATGTLGDIPPQSFVNIVMIVDPVTQQVICPKQTLEYHMNGKTERVVFGPTVLDALPQDMQHLTSIAMQQNQPDRTSSMSPSLTLEINTSDTVSILPGSIPPGVVSQSNVPEETTVTQIATKISSLSANTPPLRALSAYNFFFRDERDRILHGGEHEWSRGKQEKLLTAHWNQDRTKKRRHRKSHGKIDFTTLSRLISCRWKELSEDQKEFYRQVAAQDWERFQRELDASKKPVTGGGSEDDAVALSSTNSSMSDHFQTVIG